MTKSSTLYHMLRREIGLCSEGSIDGGLVLGNSITSASFMAWGTLPSVQILCMRRVVICSPILPTPWSSSAVI